MFEYIVMGLFIGVPVLFVVGALVAWFRQRNQTYAIEDLENTPG